MYNLFLILLWKNNITSTKNKSYHAQWQVTKLRRITFCGLR